MNRFAQHRDFLLIWAGQLISAIGSRVAGFALGIWVLRTTGSTAEFAATFIAVAIPTIVVSPLAGALVDRWDRRRTMIACDVLSAAAMLAIAVLWINGGLSIWHLYLAVAFTAVCDAF